MTSTDLGDCTIERISSTHYTAMVTNRSCYICSLISKSKCFLMSSVPVDGNIVEWTIAGPDSVTVHKLIASLKEYGYRVKFQAGGKFGDDMTLTPKEEKYLKAAFDRGYYNVPRRMDLEAPAAAAYGKFPKSQRKHPLPRRSRLLCQSFLSSAVTIHNFRAR